MTSRGLAESLGGPVFHVDFPQQEVAKSLPQMDRANYIVNHVWYAQNKGAYHFAVVTNAEKTTLWVLSRQPHPSRKNYEKLIAYVSQHFDVTKAVATPHYT